MPNGFQGTREEWNRLEEPLTSLDPVLEDFAARHGMSLSKSARAWPDRTLSWGVDIRRKIHISLVDEKMPTFKCGVIAWQDSTDLRRYTKRETLFDGEQIDRIRKNLGDLLERGRELAESWRSIDLRFATHLPGSPELEEEQRVNRERLRLRMLLATSPYLLLAGGLLALAWWFLHWLAA